MSQSDEDRSLHSLLVTHPADVLKYTRLPYFLDLFPSRKGVAKFLSNYLDMTGTLPSLKVLKRKFPKFVNGKPSRPEPLTACMGDLREELVDSIVSQYADDMAKAHAMQDIEKYVQLSEDMADRVRLVRSPIDSGALDVDTYTEERLAQLDKDATSLIATLQTGFPPLDREWGGMRGGRLYVMSSLVNLGKTYVSVAIAENIRKQGKRCLYASLEMPKNDIAERALCIRYGLNVNHYIKQDMPPEIKQPKESWYKDLLTNRLALERADKCTGRVFIMGNESGIVQPKTLRAVCREHAVDALFIDACQDIKDNALSRERVTALYSALSELNSLSVELNIPIFMTVQLQAEVEKKNIKSGNLSNIAWGQVFAQKANSVLTMLGDRSTGMRDVKIDKSRDGQVGTPFNIELVFPEIKVIATDLQPVGITLTEEDIFENPDDLDAFEGLITPNIVEDDEEEPILEKPPAPKPRMTIVDDVGDSEYLRRQKERDKKRLKNKLRRKHG